MNKRAFLAGALIWMGWMNAGASEFGRSVYAPGTSGDFSYAVLPDQPGLYMRDDLWFYQGDADYTALGGAVGVNAELKAWVDTFRLLWSSPYQVLGARYGAYASLSVADLDSRALIKTALPGQPRKAYRQDDHRFGPGDLYVSPWMLSWKRGEWDLMWYEVLTAPLGTFDADRVNASRNYFSLNSSLALTWRAPELGPEIDLRLGYYINDENPDTHYRTGSEWVGEWTAAYRFNAKLSLGLTGYAYQQITGDDGTGAVLGDFKGHSSGAGPIVRYVFTSGSRRVSLIAKWIHEFEAENRYEGDLFLVAVGTKF